MSTKSFNGRTLGPAAFEAYMDFCDKLKNGKNDEAIDRVKYICAVCEGYIIPKKPLTECNVANGANMDGESLFNDSAFGEPEGMSELDFDQNGYPRDDQFEPEETEEEILDRADAVTREEDFQNRLRQKADRMIERRQARDARRAEKADLAAEADRYLADAGYDNMASGGVRPDNAKFFGDQFNVDF